MDMELVVWILIFMGGYGAVLAWLLRKALSSAAERESGDGTPPLA